MNLNVELIINIVIGIAIYKIAHIIIEAAFSRFHKSTTIKVDEIHEYLTKERDDLVNYKKTIDTFYKYWESLRKANKVGCCRDINPDIKTFGRGKHIFEIFLFNEMKRQMDEHEEYKQSLKG